MRSLTIAIGILSLFAAGCASEVSKHWGEAYQQNKAAMIANPEAGTEPDEGVVDFEGGTVETVMERYRKEQTQSRDQKMPTSILIQGMGGSKN
ncbi:MAG TPA: hypothetical protein VIY27_12375 [Myxococcota bacterium]